MRTTLAALALLTASPALSRAAEELEASLKVSGRVVEVQVRHKDGRPAAGVPVRLLYGRQQEGRHPVPRHPNSRAEQRHGSVAQRNQAVAA